MKKVITTRASDATAMVEAAWQAVGESFERFCRRPASPALTGMMEEDTERLCGPRHGGRTRGMAIAGDGRRAGWGSTAGRSRLSGYACADGTAAR